MLQVSLAEKIEVLIKIITSSPIFICITFFTILLNFALYINKNNRKNIKKAFIVFYVILFIGLILVYGNTVVSILDYLVENIIKLIYFPNLAAYIIMIILANIITLKTLLSNKSNFIKLINTTIYSMITLLFLITLYIVTKNNVDVYKMFDVYTNKDLLVLIELSSNITIIWIIAIMISRLIDFISIKIDNKDIHVKEEKVIPNNVISVKEYKKPNREPKKIRHYDGPIIDIPLTPVKAHVSIFSRINSLINNLVDTIVDSQKNKRERIISNKFVSIKEVKNTNKEPKEIKHYDGPLIDNPITSIKTEESIFSRISSLINNLVDTVVDLQKNKVEHNEELVEANNSYLNKVLLEEERPHKNKYITITEIPKEDAIVEIPKEEPIPKLKHNEFFLDENITLSECYELRKSILLLQENRRKVQQ